LLVLDEAHLLSDRLLEEVRMLVDLAQQGVPLVRVVLCGNPEFEERLTAPGLSAFNQRVACHEPIETLLRSEAIDYLEYRIQWAGGTVDRLFDAGAMRLIAEASDGVPRCLNQLAEHSLTQAFLVKAPIASESIVRQSLAALQHLPLRWNASALLSRSWSAKTEDVPLSEAKPVSNADTTVFEAISDEMPTTDEGRSSSFEFGAGDSHEVGHEVESIPVTAETAASLNGPQSEVDEHSVNSGTSNAASVGAVANESAFVETDADGVCSFEIGGPAPVIENVHSLTTSDKAKSAIDDTEITIDSARNLSESESPEADSSSASRQVFIRVALNGLVSEKTIEIVQSTEENSEPDEKLDEEIDQNQPQFSWLIHPVVRSELEDEPTEEELLPEETVSEFKLPVRYRARSQPEFRLSDIATKVSKSDPLIGRSNHLDAIRQRAFSPNKVQTGGTMGSLTETESNLETLEEEVVVDRYADLDAICRSTVPRAPSLSRVQHFDAPILDAANADALEPQLNDDVLSQHSSEQLQRNEAISTVVATAPGLQPQSHQSSHDEQPQPDFLSPNSDDFTGYPMERIDSICALIETADDHSNGGSGVELITDWGVERIDVDLPSDTISAVFSNGDGQRPFDLEDWLGSTVIEVGRDLRQQVSEPPLKDAQVEAKVASEKSSPESKSDISERVERASRYDIVEPETIPENQEPETSQFRVDPPETGNSESENVPDPATRSTTHSRFHNLFSTLRRRQVPQN
ncbi:MAG: hypothetical protein JWM11_2350, partial [Planctomycetaceae bacterium]|nr:hypothetical protein [Planctomycetaceae bacterium]